MAEGMVGSLGRAPEECQAQGECQALGSSCVQMGPGSAREGRRWAVPDGGTQSRRPESQGAPRGGVGWGLGLSRPWGSKAKAG